MKSRIATPQPQRRSTGSLEKGSPVPPRNMTKQLFLAHSFSVSQHLCFTRGSTASNGHLHPFSWDRASGPEAGARILLTLGALEKMLGFLDVVVRKSIDHKAGPNLVEKSRHRPLRNWRSFLPNRREQLRDPSLRPTRARSCRKQRTVHGVFLTFLEKSQMLLSDGDVAPFLKTRPIPVGRRRGPMHRKDVTRQDLNQFSRVTHTRERPIHTFTTSLLPVRGMERAATIKEDTHDPPSWGPKPSSWSCSRLSLQALRTRVRTYSSEFCQKTNHCLTHSISACTTGSAFLSKPMAILDVTHLPDFGQTASAARDRMPCMVDGATPILKAGA